MPSPQTMVNACSTLGRVRSRTTRNPPQSQQPYSNFGTLRRDHIITDTIPGPESCV